MSIRKTPGGKDGRCVRVTTLPPSYCRKSCKSRALTYRNPFGLSGPAHENNRTSAWWISQPIQLTFEPYQDGGSTDKYNSQTISQSHQLSRVNDNWLVGISDNRPQPFQVRWRNNGWPIYQRWLNGSVISTQATARTADSCRAQDTFCTFLLPISIKLRIEDLHVTLLSHYEFRTIRGSESLALRSRTNECTSVSDLGETRRRHICEFR